MARAVTPFGRGQCPAIELLGSQPIRTVRGILGVSDRSLGKEQQAEKMFAPHESAIIDRRIAAR